MSIFDINNLMVHIFDLDDQTSQANNKFIQISKLLVYCIIELFNFHIIEYHSMTSIVPYFGRFDYVSVELLTQTYTPIISPSSVSYIDKQHIPVIQRQL